MVHVGEQPASFLALALSLSSSSSSRSLSTSPPWSCAVDCSMGGGEGGTEARSPPLPPSLPPSEPTGLPLSALTHTMALRQHRFTSRFSTPCRACASSPAVSPPPPCALPTSQALNPSLSSMSATTCRTVRPRSSGEGSTPFARSSLSASRTTSRHTTSGSSSLSPSTNRSPTSFPPSAPTGNSLPIMTGMHLSSIPAPSSSSDSTHSSSTLSHAEPSFSPFIRASAYADTTGTTTRERISAPAKSSRKLRPLSSRLLSRNTRTALLSTSISRERRKKRPCVSSASTLPCPPTPWRYEINTW
mmetsp:Transcript_31291/g.79414  ORF Transcript_31291/g.79414 Transcript_31291/m.79414 type:complete len:302 (-) Transcript_31291:175-1080(-)